MMADGYGAPDRPGVAFCAHVEGGFIVRRSSVAIIAALLVVGVCAPATFGASPAAGAAVPRVVFIVGPAGSATDSYRAQARAAAAIARKYTPDVVEVYSPNATWTAVKQATTGASLVVYMGHGNGWPSPYRDSLFPATQNGFGLNPSAGGDDRTHQYFGEDVVGSQLKFARNAVVLLNHLCYASGLSEPGLPEGTLDQARQRVDNYAAGFIRAGAAAVIAEAWSSPSYFVGAILGGGRSMQTAWQKGPSANGNRIAFASIRSPGYVAQMDPETAASGFERSIVMKTGLAPADVLAGARGALGVAPPAAPPEPTLTGTGITLATPDISGLTSAGSTVDVAVPYTIKDRKALPKALQASVRWDPVAVAMAPVDPASAVGGTDPATPTGTGAGPAAAPGAADPAAAPTPTPTAPPVLGPRGKEFIEAPIADTDLVIPERAGDVVAPVAVKIGKTSLAVPVALPGAPGRYRLTITLHDADGVAYDAATQALLPTLSVRVTGDYDGAIEVIPSAQLTAGQQVLLGLRVANLGRTAWGHGVIQTPSSAMTEAPAEAATVVARWIPLSAGAALPTDESTHAADASLPIGLAPGHKADAILGLSVPTVPGDYLLVLDVVTPERGSLIASGADPTLVRITVVAAPK
jgi:hypothetical protein